MKPYTKAELSAMRARWAQSWAERQAAPADTLAPGELAQRLAQRQADELASRKAESLRVAAHHRRLRAEAAAHGDKETARTLGMLAAHLEQSAALAEAEIRDRATKRAKAQRAMKNRELAHRQRPGRRPALRDALAETLGPLKREGAQFKTIMRRWERERIGSLRLEDLGGGRYLVTDEDGDTAAQGSYTWGTLQRIYSESR